MILGSCMESPSGSGQAGIRIPGCSLPVQGSRLASALESASLAASAGDGITGGTIGITTVSLSTTTPTYLIAGFSRTATTSITPVDFTAEGFTVAPPEEDSPAASMGLQHRTARVVRIPVLSVVLIMEESRGDSPRAGSPALVEASMG